MRQLFKSVLLLVSCASFMASTPGPCGIQKKNASFTKITINQKDQLSQNEAVEMIIHPLDIFSLRYF